jgi:hypothetical protein
MHARENAGYRCLAFGNTVNDVVVLEVNYKCAVFPAGYWRIANGGCFADGFSPAGLHGSLLHTAGRAVGRLPGYPVYNKCVSRSGAQRNSSNKYPGIDESTEHVFDSLQCTEWNEYSNRLLYPICSRSQSRSLFSHSGFTGDHRVLWQMKFPVVGADARLVVRFSASKALLI